MTTFVITNCTNRKRNVASPVTPLVPAERSIETFARSWVEQLESAEALLPAANLYVGRSVVDAKLVSSMCSAEFMVVSAGLGLVGGNCQVPNYQLTVVDGVGSIRSWLVRHNYSPADWWSTLNFAIGKFHPISSLVNGSNAGDLFLIALPSTYIELIAGDLSSVQSDLGKRLRIFSSIAGRELLPKHLSSQAMPYDDRLEGVCDYAGTRSDFPQRAMRHFVEKLRGHDLSTSDGADAVQKVMTGSRAREVPRRTKLDDIEISKLIAANWQSTSGSASKLLRVLRDGNLVACEQSRFSSLWRKVRDQLANGEQLG